MGIEVKFIIKDKEKIQGNFPEMEILMKGGERYYSKMAKQDEDFIIARDLEKNTIAQNVLYLFIHGQSGIVWGASPREYFAGEKLKKLGIYKEIFFKSPYEH